MDLVERVGGDYTTVVGFPLKLVAHLLQSVGYPIPVNVKTCISASRSAVESIPGLIAKA